MRVYRPYGGRMHRAKVRQGDAAVRPGGRRGEWAPREERVSRGGWQARLCGLCPWIARTGRVDGVFAKGRTEFVKVVSQRFGGKFLAAS